MRTVVADQRQRLLATSLSQDLETYGPIPQDRERTRQVAQFAVDLDRQRGPREAGADRRSGVCARGALIERQLAAVWKLVFHCRLMLAGDAGATQDATLHLRLPGD